MAVIVTNKGKTGEEIKVGIKIRGTTKMETSFKLKKGGSEMKAKAMGLLWILKKEQTREVEILVKDRTLVEWIGGGITRAEDEAWINTKEENMWKQVLRKMRKRNEKITIKTTGEKTKGRRRLENMERNLKGNKNIREKEQTIKTEDKYNKKGANLMTITQKTAYELALKRNATQKRREGKKQRKT